jgi:hypothetical protein
MREQRLHEVGTFDETRDALGTEHVQHGLGDPIGVGRSETEGLHSGHLRLEEQIGLAEGFVEGQRPCDP